MVWRLQRRPGKCGQNRAVQADGHCWHLLPLVQPGQASPQDLSISASILLYVMLLQSWFGCNKGTDN